MPQDLYGIVGGENMSAEEYCARAFACICNAVLDHVELGGGLLINYSSLPSAVEAEILTHFAIDTDAKGRAAMQTAAGRDAQVQAVDRVGVAELADKAVDLDDRMICPHDCAAPAARVRFCSNASKAPAPLVAVNKSLRTGS